MSSILRTLKWWRLLHDTANWDGYVEARFPASWRECRRGAGPAQEVAAQGDGGVLPEACTDGDRDRSLRCQPPFGTAAAIVRAYGEADRTAAGQAVRQARQERCGRRRSALRGDEPADDALRAGEDDRAASSLDAGRCAGQADPQSHTARQHLPRLCRRVWPDRRRGEVGTTERACPKACEKAAPVTTRVGQADA